MKACYAEIMHSHWLFQVPLLFLTNWVAGLPTFIEKHLKSNNICPKFAFVATNRADGFLML